MSGTKETKGTALPAKPKMKLPGDTAGGQLQPAAAPKSNRVGFKIELQQESINALGDAFRKLSVYASAVVGLFGWAANNAVGAFAAAGVVWLAVQVLAIGIESVRVYPLDEPDDNVVIDTEASAEDEGAIP